MTSYTKCELVDVLVRQVGGGHRRFRTIIDQFVWDKTKNGTSEPTYNVRFLKDDSLAEGIPMDRVEKAFEPLQKLLMVSPPTGRGALRRPSRVDMSLLVIDCKQLGRVRQWIRKNKDIVEKDSHELWDPKGKHVQVSKEMIKRLVIPGFEVCGEMLHRSLTYMQVRFAPEETFVHVHPASATAMLVGPSGIRLNPRVALQWAQKRGTSWFQHMDQGSSIFLPVNYPADHWLAVVLWAAIPRQEYRVRVYNSYRTYRETDPTIALAAVKACETMDQYNRSWFFDPCRDILNQREGDLRCDIHTIARAVQVISKQTNLKLDLRGVDDVSKALAWASLEHNKYLCHDHAPAAELSS